ncbi:MAG: hypothetical protein IJH98_00630 [Solobacterium sp.]|nr:hypothetical protein [Solobacterium sp.]
MLTQYLVVARFDHNRRKKYHDSVKPNYSEAVELANDVDRYWRTNTAFRGKYLGTEIWSREVTEWRKEE